MQSEKFFAKTSFSKRGLIAMFFLFLTYFQGFCQQDSIAFKIVDSCSNESIQNAHVSNIDKQIIAISNNDGLFEIDPPLISTDSLIVSCIGYRNTFLIVSNLLKEQIIKLEKDTIILDELVIQPMSAKEVVLKSIESIEKNYLNKNIITRGTFNLQIIKDTTLLRSSKSKIEVKSNSHIYSPEISTLSYLTQLGSSEIINNDSELIEETFLFDHIIQGRGFLNKENIDSWRFSVTGYTSYEEKEVIIINANFISNGTVLHSGNIFINLSDFGILKIEYKYKWKKLKLKPTDVDSLRSNQSSWSGFAYYTKTTSSNKYDLLNLGYIIQKEIYYRNVSTSYKFKKLNNYQIQTDFNAD